MFARARPRKRRLNVGAELRQTVVERLQLAKTPGDGPRGPIFWGNADDVRDVTGCEMNVCNIREIEFRMMISELEYDGYWEYIV